MTPVVVDASVWVAAVDCHDPSHVAARDYLRQLAHGNVVVVVPMHARVEVAGALARRAADALYAAVASREGATLITLDREMIERANGVRPEGSATDNR